MRVRPAILFLLTCVCFAAREPDDWIGRLGGTAERNAAEATTGLNLRGSWVNDTEMLAVADLPELQKLDLSHTRISDEGLLRLKSARKITDLSLFYSEWITDQGLTAVRE